MFLPYLGVCEGAKLPKIAQMNNLAKTPMFLALAGVRARRKIINISNLVKTLLFLAFIGGP